MCISTECILFYSDFLLLLCYTVYCNRFTYMDVFNYHSVFIARQFYTLKFDVIVLVIHYTFYSHL